METAANAAERVRDVARPDLLLLAAFFHDIGKGLPGDHSVAGAEVAARITQRLGLEPADATFMARFRRPASE